MIKVRTTQNFIVGPMKKVVLAQGREFFVQPDNEGNFSISLENGGVFGTCNINRGFEVIPFTEKEQKLIDKHAEV